MTRISFLVGEGVFQINNQEDYVGRMAEKYPDTIYFFEPEPNVVALINAGYRLAEANELRDNAMLELVGAVHAGRNSGLSVTEIHRLTGVSRQSLHKLIKKLNAVHCSNPECPNAGRCGGECARNF